MKCEICSNYMSQLDSCKFCHFEYCERYIDDTWCILDLDFNDMGVHYEILYRLKAKGIDCIYADIYYDMNIAFLLGCYANIKDIARALGVGKDVVYGNNEFGIVIINLFQEKYLIGDLE